MHSSPPKANCFQTAFHVAVVAVVLTVSGCATPVGVRYLDPKDVGRNLTASVLSGDNLSAETMQILNRSGLAARFESEPEQVIAAIHKGLRTAKETDRIYALAELSFLHASQGGDKSYFLSSAIYAYAFLFPADGGDLPNPFDPRLRIAADLYNQGLGRGFKSEESREIVLKDGTYKVPFGDIVVRTNPEEFCWGAFRLVKFIDASELEVRGLRNRYRWHGVGAPLVASLERLPWVEDPAFARIPPGIKIAATVFLRLDDVKKGLETGHVTARLELLTAEKDTSITVDGRSAPIEFGLSSALAYTLEGSQVYRMELKGLLSGDFLLFKEAARFRDNVFFIEPYRPGCIPLILVHGTASSPARWAQLINEIQNDRKLWGRYQIWLFTYNTGNPVLYSAGILVESLKNTVKTFDPEGKDPAMKKMVVVGHSQGGLLTKLTAVDSGEQFWISDTPFDQVKLSPDAREMLKRSLFHKPLPFVKRVIFMATPHRGSYVSGGWIGKLAGKLISLPRTVLSPLTEVVTGLSGQSSIPDLKNIPKSTDNMAPDSRFIKIISSLPIAPGIVAHSIIPVKNPDDPKEEWNDGVVEYKSAHIDGAASELIVHSGHSTQEEPQTIEEVRRILIENLKEP
ncbi:MAG: esterase/lipase family protein [Syntrophobacteraceae bacterium]